MRPYPLVHRRLLAPTHMTVRTLRHYHQVGLLEPAEVDPHTGYRRYTTDQIPTAQVIRRFRDLGMPLEEVQAVLSAPDQCALSRRLSRASLVCISGSPSNGPRPGTDKNAAELE